MILFLFYFFVLCVRADASITFIIRVFAFYFALVCCLLIFFVDFCGFRL